MDQIKSSILNSLPSRYKLEWAVQIDSPIRFKVFATKHAVSILNQIWSNAFTKVTNCEFHSYRKYNRMNIPYNDSRVTISIFPTGTIMFQGKNSAEWVYSYIEQVAREVEYEMEDQKSNLNRSNDSELSNNSVSILGICAMCDEKDNSYMVECHKCSSWTHHLCDNLTEETARKIPIYYCAPCRMKYDCLKVQNTSTPISTKPKKLPCPNFTDLDEKIESVNQDINEMNDDSSLSISGEMSLSSFDLSVSHEEHLSKSESSINQIETPFQPEPPMEEKHTENLEGHESNPSTPPTTKSLNENKLQNEILKAETENLPDKLMLPTPNEDDIQKVTINQNKSTFAQTPKSVPVPSPNTFAPRKSLKQMRENRPTKTSTSEKVENIASQNGEKPKNLEENSIHKESHSSELLKDENPPPKLDLNVYEEKEIQNSSKQPDANEIVSCTQDILKKKESGYLEEALKNLTNLENDDSGEDDSPLRSLKNICKEVRNSVQQKIGKPPNSPFHSEEKSEFNHESSRLQENLPKSIEIMMGIAKNLQYLKYQNLEKDIEAETLRQSLKEAQKFPKKANNKTAKDHKLNDYTKQEIINKVMNLEHQVEDLKAEITLITDLKDLYKKKWLLLNKELEETNDNIISIEEITGDLLHKNFKEVSPQMRLTGMLQEAEDKIKSHIINEQIQQEEINDLKAKIHQQSSEIHHLRQIYRTNKLPSGLQNKKSNKAQVQKDSNTNLILPSNDTQTSTACPISKNHYENSNENRDSPDSQLILKEPTSLEVQTNNDYPLHSHQPQYSSQLHPNIAEHHGRENSENNPHEHILPPPPEFSNQPHPNEARDQRREIHPHDPNLPPPNDSRDQRREIHPHDHNLPPPNDSRYRQNFHRNRYRTKHTYDNQPINREELRRIPDQELQNHYHLPQTHRSRQIRSPPRNVRYVPPERYNKNHGYLPRRDGPQAEDPPPWFMQDNHYDVQRRQNYHPVRTDVYRHNNYTDNPYQKNQETQQGNKPNYSSRKENSQKSYENEPNPQYSYQAASMFSPRYDMYNMYKQTVDNQNYTTQRNQTMQEFRNDTPPLLKNQAPMQSEYERVSNEESSQNIKHELIPEEYELRNKKNFTEYYEQKKERPFCPFLRKGRCPSTRCLYYHPIIISYENKPQSNDDENNLRNEYANETYSYKQYTEDFVPHQNKPQSNLYYNHPPPSTNENVNHSQY